VQDSGLIHAVVLLWPQHTSVRVQVWPGQFLREEPLMREIPADFQGISRNLKFWSTPPTPPAPALTLPPGIGPPSHLLRYAAVSLIVAFVAGIFCTPHVVARKSEQRRLDVIIGFCFTANFMAGWLYTIVIPTMHDFVVHYGASEAFGGWVIGGIKLGSVGGVLITAVWDWRQPGQMLQHPKKVMSTSFVIHTLACAWYLSAVAGHWNRRTVLSSVLASRLLSGVAEGMQTIFLYMYLGNKVEVNERPAKMTMLLAFSVLGNAAGPMFSSVAESLGPKWLPSFACCAAAAAIGSVLYLTAVLALLPHDCPETDQGCIMACDATQPARPSEADTHTARTGLLMLMCSCLVVSSLRSFMASALETVTALALEVEDTFRWTSIGSGIGTGLVVLLCLPIIVLFHTTKKVPSFDFVFLRAGVVLTLLGTSLVHDDWCKLVQSRTKCLALLFGGDALAFAGLLFLGGLADGIAAKHAERQGLLSMSTYTIMRSLMNNALARGVGPPSARFAFNTGGRGAYATLQFTLAVVALVASEQGIIRQARKA